MSSYFTSFLLTWIFSLFLCERAQSNADMGLGKTIQGVASMSIYFKEWPLLVLCPSGARYHWENEFKQWLGIDSAVNNPKTKVENEKDDGDKVFPDSNRNQKRQSYVTPMTTHDASNGKGPALLHEWQINVLGSARGAIFPHSDTKVVICSYGLSSVLIETGKIVPGMFRCAIVDESHMLKNKAAKRTTLLIPVLSATDRCVLLSGTPALARPVELYPQLTILGTERHGWDLGTEDEFMEKYGKNGSPQRSAELHTMLRGTVMIRRLKNDILKTLPRKSREKAEIHVIGNREQRDEFSELLVRLREGKGVMGKLARLHYKEQDADAQSPNEKVTMETIQEQKKWELEQLKRDTEHQFVTNRDQIQDMLLYDDRYMHLSDDQRAAAMEQSLEQVRANIQRHTETTLQQIESRFYTLSSELIAANERAETNRATVLCRLYTLTGDTKVPLIIDTLRRWLDDPTKGKVCIFAHHISVLDAIQQGVGLSNTGGRKSTKFIRIDGQTLPKARQDQITAFQTDLSIRVALLGITAAGVAVTLTASSTVWFAELFWTPAIMIQAEGTLKSVTKLDRRYDFYSH
jgi:SNF2 family DNA or RNA helicase